MPRNQGTSRKGKPGKQERSVGLGNALQRAHRAPTGPPKKSQGGMQQTAGVASIGIDSFDQSSKTKSILELQNVDDFLLQADLANREFLSERENVIVVDATTQAYRPPSVQWDDYNKTTNFVFQELCVPRRPAWDANMSAQELDRQEQHAFLEWRRGIAAKEEELLRHKTAWDTMNVTPFEKNIEVWRQLWRVLERSACLLQLVDARNPLFYLSDDMKEYANSLGKPMLVLINKSDYLSRKQREEWRDYLTQRGWEYLFFSATKEQTKLDAAAHEERHKEQQDMDPRLRLDNVILDEDDEDDEDEDESDDDNDDEDDEVDPLDSQQEHGDEADGSTGNDAAEDVSADGFGVDVPLTREQLLEAMMTFAAKHDCQPDPRYDDRIQFGMVGFPNVGKSSVINVCVGSSKHTHGLVRVGVASQPGKTKHFQTLLLPDRDDMMLCDCPGLVFPSFVSNTADLIAAGVYPIAQMRDHNPVISLICERIPRDIINAQYGINLPVPSVMELRERGLMEVPPPTAEEFLTTLCIARSMLAAASGVPDYTRAARMIIKDYAAGRLLYCHPPPTVGDEEAFAQETIATALTNTQKLREKLERQQQSAEGARLKEVNEEVASGILDATDDNFLEFLDGTNGDDASSAALDKQRSEKKHHKQPKGGKKGKKKLREKDPYGCDRSPDDLIQHYSSGVSVKAGKYSDAGYTRPSYVGIRNAKVGSES